MIGIEINIQASPQFSERKLNYYHVFIHVFGVLFIICHIMEIIVDTYLLLLVIRYVPGSTPTSLQSEYTPLSLRWLLPASGCAYV